jgi:hypothetical protein
MSAMTAYPLIAQFSASIRRPSPRQSGMVACLYGANGPDADAIVELGKTRLLDALVDVALVQSGSEIGGFQAYVRRPKPLQSGMVAMFYAENGEQADSVTAMSLSRYVETQVAVNILLLQDADGKDQAAPPRSIKGPYGEQAARLWRAGFLLNPAVLARIGDDDAFRRWIWGNPCCVSTEYGEHGGDVVAAHVERINTGSGIGIKSQYAYVPMCHQHHMRQHQHGESAVGGKDVMDKRRAKFVQAWAAETLAKKFDVQGLSWIPPQALRKWASEQGLAGCYPA